MKIVKIINFLPVNSKFPEYTILCSKIMSTKRTKFFKKKHGASIILTNTKTNCFSRLGYEIRNYILSRRTLNLANTSKISHNP